MAQFHRGIVVAYDLTSGIGQAQSNASQTVFDFQGHKQMEVKRNKKPTRNREFRFGKQSPACTLRAGNSVFFKVKNGSWVTAIGLLPGRPTRRQLIQRLKKERSLGPRTDGQAALHRLRPAV